MGDWDAEIITPKRKRKFLNFNELIIYEDDQVIVINKPKGFTSIEDRWDKEGPNLLSMGKRYWSDLQICHRLDKMTSGVLVFAKTPEAYRDISIQFQEREITKFYLALVEGIKEFKEFTIDAPISQGRDGRMRVDALNGKDAITIVDTDKMYRNYTLLNCQPLTGRTHQIRVHLSGLGCPITGDQEYGGKDVFLSELKRNYKLNRRGEELPLNDGYLLHARGLNLKLPGSGEEKNFIAPLPDHFEIVLKMIEKYGA